ncbi:probable protein phosphatase 2C 51 isoform X2 [Cornus florida]|uniref:probable protein phosphatase 2C 51 isoform X2 n=1 Tax=Cornus florida TaxID=4283 RepID=UPI00289AD6C2|nr:probable protein phosphatase 2C 51 isoform X2 [Cornus florida]
MCLKEIDSNISLALGFHLQSLQKDNSITKLMMKRLNIVVLLVLLLSAISSATQEVSVSCMMLYDEGGAPAVFESPECSQWVISPESLRNQAANCQFATLQGHREYQEDRIACNLEMKIPFVGKNGTKEVMVGIAAIFDGHSGAEASEMASKCFLDYFYLHVVFNAYKQALSYQEEHGLRISNSESYKGFLPANDDESIKRILKEALLRTIQDIDLKFSLEAFSNRYFSGSTATVAVLVDGQILVANVGDSKALLCSRRTESLLEPEGTSMGKLHAVELTRDHHPDRDDERARIEAAGGHVRVWGVPRVNGILAMSRSIGDIYLKRYGVIATPELKGWQPLTANDVYLVIASDGIFESLKPDDVCHLLSDKNSSSRLSSSSLADCIVKKAFKKGSTDNLTAIVVPLRSTAFSQDPPATKEMM